MNRKALMASTLAVALLAAVLGMAPTASASRPQTRAAAAVASGTLEPHDPTPLVNEFVAGGCRLRLAPFPHRGVT